jgi:hypothetical protein
VPAIEGQKQYSQMQSAKIKCFEHPAKEKKQCDMHAVLSQLAPAAILKLADKGGDVTKLTMKEQHIINPSCLLLHRHASQQKWWLQRNLIT